jgi:hypothetical protein
VPVWMTDPAGVSRVHDPGLVDASVVVIAERYDIARVVMSRDMTREPAQVARRVGRPSWVETPLAYAWQRHPRTKSSTLRRIVLATTSVTVMI